MRCHSLQIERLTTSIRWRVSFKEWLASRLFFKGLHRWISNNFCGQVIPHIHYPLAEGKCAQIKPRSILSQFYLMSSQSRGVSHLEEVLNTERPPGSHGGFHRPISCLPCPSYKTMNQDLILCSLERNVCFCAIATTIEALLPLGHHTLGIACRGVLSTRVDRMVVGNRVGADLTRNTINSFAPI